MFKFMQARFEWPDDKLALYQGIFGMAHVPGISFGVILGMWLMKKSRRNCMQICAIVAMIGMGIQMIENMWCITAGKMILGFSSGIMSASAGRILEEFTP